MTFGEQDPNDLFITAIMGQRFLENFVSFGIVLRDTLLFLIGPY
jgi:hypothetical protein